MWTQLASWVRLVTALGFTSLLFFTFLFARVAQVTSFGCLDESGKSVDWFIVYKIPKLQKQPSPFDTGLAYSYITSGQNAGKWTVAKQLVNETQSMVRRTMDQVYKSWKDYTHLQYNDDPPVGNGK
jgi:deoxyribonuclease-2